MATGGSTTQSEWLALQRRYHAQLLTPDDELPLTASNSSSTFARLFMHLTDPDLPTAFAGETELRLELPVEYPEREPAFDLAGFRSRLTAQQFRAIDAALKTRARELRGTLSLRKLLTWLDNNFYPLMMAAGEEESKDRQTSDSAEAVDESSEVAITPDESVETTTATAAEQTTKDKKKTRRRKKDPSKTLCKFFLRQSCKSGEECKFSHEVCVKKEEEQAVAAAPESGESSSTTAPALPKVSQGDAAATSKPKSRKAKVAAPPKEDKISTPSPVEKAKKPKKAKKPRVCKFFANDTCREGEKCKFLHEKKSPSDAVSQQPEKPKGIVIKVLKASSPLESTPQHTTSDAQKPADPSSTAPPPPSSDDWSESQQKALDKALKKYPATFDKKIRWLSIASEVDGKSLNECIDRFKLLCQLVRDEQPSAGESTQESSKAVEDGDAADNCVADKRIIPAETRTAIQTEPEQKGAQIRLDDLFLYQIGTLVPHRLVCQVQCTNCPLKLDAVLTLDNPSIRKWCPRCSVLHLVHLRPVFAHASSSVLAYVDTNENCTIMDVVPSELLATCLECGNEVLFPSVTPTRRSEHACFSCHTKLAMLTKRYVVGQFATEGASKKVSSASSSPTVKKATPKRIVDNFVLGQPLPNKGACEHYRHSFRWFRFQCCGKAFPCDVCHDRSDCAEANTGKIASRMICGLCSKEQSSAVKECACGNEVGKKKVTSSHWEGGAGCRDPNRMSPTDRKKYRGFNKTESKKQNRVGLAAKQARREVERGVPHERS